MYIDAKRKMVLILILVLLILLTLSVFIPDIGGKAGWNDGTIRIKSDGIVEPSDAPLKNDGNTYVLTNDIEITFGDGIVVEKDNIIIDGNNYTLKGGGSDVGVLLYHRRSVEIRNMRIQNFSTGVFLSSSSNNRIVGNNIESNSYGIYLDYSSNNEIIGNRLISCGLGWFGDSHNNVVKDNTVNGKPLVYLENEYNKIIRNIDLGQVILVRCNNMTIENLHISKTSIGIGLLGTNGSIIINNNIENNICGVKIWDSSNNEISGNNIENNRDIGIYLYDSFNNKIIGNNIKGNNENNQIGIHLTGFSIGSSNNEVIGNNIENNGDGIFIFNSSSNKVYLNNFINNIRQVRQEITYSNFWDNGSKGNYWSDYGGVDSNNDGVGDTPYVIHENNRDNYPLMMPYYSSCVLYSLPANLVSGGGLINWACLTSVFPQQIIFTYPGETISLNVSYSILGSNPSEIDQMFLLYSWSPSWPPPSGYYAEIYNGIPPSWPGIDGSKQINITVPTVSGTYYLWVGWGAHYSSAQEAVQGFTKKPSLPAHIIIIVSTLEPVHPVHMSLDSALLNGQELSIDNPEVIVSPDSMIHGIVTFTVENAQPGSWITLIWVSSWERGSVADGKVRVIREDTRKTSQFTVNIDANAPSNTGTYYIGFFASWMYNPDEVASGDHPPNYGDGDDVWDLRQSDWEAIISNGQPPEDAPYRIPGRVIRIVVQQGLCSVSISSPYGVITGEGWYSKGSTVTISISENIVDHDNGTRRVFKGWLENGLLVSGEQSFHMTVDRPRTIIAKWDTEYRVSVSTPYGSATGSGWHKSGEIATISISLTRLEKDFFANHVFEGWRVDGSIVSTSPNYSFIVNGPVTIVASWKTEIKPSAIGLIAGLILLIIASMTILIVKRKRKPSPPRPRPSPPTTPIGLEVKKLEEYLEKLEQLRKEGKVSETVYDKLKQEYKKKLEELVDKLKK